MNAAWSSRVLAPCLRESRGLPGRIPGGGGPAIAALTERRWVIGLNHPGRRVFSALARQKPAASRRSCALTSERQVSGMT